MTAAHVNAILILSIAVACAGCLRTTSFACTDDGACGADGKCEIGVGFCSFADGSCASGRRFGDLSGQFANQCVGDQSGGDGGVGDAGIDAPTGCPATGYMPLGGSLHKYKLRSASSWSSHKSACASDGGFLAVPDDATELTAILGLSAGTTWIGVTDQAQENTFVTVLGAPATFLPWAAGQPDNAPGNADCVTALTTMQYADDKCVSSYVGVCECVPL